VVEFKILGPLEVWDRGRQLAVPGPKQRALLAVLLLHANHVVSSDRLIDELWGEESPESGSAALRMRVSELRKALPEGLVQTRAPGYLIRAEGDRLDLHRFERLVEEGRRALEAGAAVDAAARLREALGLWRGPPLDDLAYEPFAQPVIARLDELRLAALELRIEADLALGRHDELVGELDQLVAEHPLRERFRRQLMLALYRSGRQGEALELYRRGRAVLVEGLGIEPGSALQELEKAILRQDPALELPASTAASGDAVTSPDRSILVGVLDPARLDALLAVAEPLARRPPREVILARLLRDARELDSATRGLHERCGDLAGHGVVARAAVFTSEEAGGDLVRLASEQDVDLVLVDAPTGLLDAGLPDAELAAVLAATPCDVALLAGPDGTSDGPVLVPFGAVEHDWAAVELGAWVARANGAPLRLLGSAAVPEKGKRDASRILSHASLVVQRALGVLAEPALVSPGEEGILEASAGAGLVIVGLSARWHREGLGPARLRLAREVKSPLLLVRRGARPGGLAPKASLTRFTWSVRAAR
jgi:DNA-binding SARP family transcriptional activator